MEQASLSQSGSFERSKLRTSGGLSKLDNLPILNFIDPIHSINYAPSQAGIFLGVKSSVLKKPTDRERFSEAEAQLSEEQREKIAINGFIANFKMVQTTNAKPLLGEFLKRLGSTDFEIRDSQDEIFQGFEITTQFQLPDTWQVGDCFTVIFSAHQLGTSLTGVADLSTVQPYFLVQFVNTLSYSSSEEKAVNSLRFFLHSYSSSSTRVEPWAQKTVSSKKDGSSWKLFIAYNAIEEEIVATATNLNDSSETSLKRKISLKELNPPRKNALHVSLHAQVQRRNFSGVFVKEWTLRTIGTQHNWNPLEIQMMLVVDNCTNQLSATHELLGLQAMSDDDPLISQVLDEAIQLSKELEILQKKSDQKVPVTRHKLFKAIRNLILALPPPSSFLQDFGTLLSSGYASDLTFFNASNSHLSLSCHRAIISSRCPALFALVGEQREYAVSNSGFAWEDFVGFVTFLYSDRIPIVPKEREAVFKVCSVYKVIPKKGHLRQDIAQITKRPEFFDTTIRLVNEGELEPTEIAIPKILLTARNPFFHGLLSGHFAKQAQSAYVVHDLLQEHFELLLHYFATDTLPKDITCQIALEVIIEAHHILDDRLRWLLENAVVEALDTSNVIELFLLARSYSLHTLEWICLRFIKKNFRAVSVQENFLELDRETLKELYIEFNPENLKHFEHEDIMKKFNEANPSPQSVPKQAQEKPFDLNKNDPPPSKKKPSKKKKKDKW